MIKVKDLIKKLNAFDKDMEIVIDSDENGFYSLEGIEEVVHEDGEIYVNLISSNES